MSSPKYRTTLQFTLSKFHLVLRCWKLSWILACFFSFLSHIINYFFITCDYLPPNYFFLHLSRFCKFTGIFLYHTIIIFFSKAFYLNAVQQLVDCTESKLQKHFWDFSHIVQKIVGNFCINPIYFHSIYNNNNKPQL